MKFVTLGNWCKWLEKNFSPEVMIPGLPTIIRFDGNSFHTYCKGLVKPFDENLTDLMIATTKFVVEETNAVVGYCQSDEISIILYSADRKSPIYHEGKKQKILSKLTGKLITFFNDQRQMYLPGHNKTALFDARIYQVPTLDDAVAQLIWRENDATKNSISMLAQSHFSHKSLQKLSGSQMQDRLMLEKNVNWNDLPVKFKRGTYVKRYYVDTPFTVDELNTLPPKHKAHSDPNLIITRRKVRVLEYPIMTTIKNKVDVIFNNASPILNNQ